MAKEVCLPAPATDLHSERLILHPVDVTEAKRIVVRQPGPDDCWAQDFPFDGDVIGATLCLRATASHGATDVPVRRSPGARQAIHRGPPHNARRGFLEDMGRVRSASGWRASCWGVSEALYGVGLDGCREPARQLRVDVGDQGALVGMVDQEVA